MKNIDRWIMVCLLIVLLTGAPVVLAQTDKDNLYQSGKLEIYQGHYAKAVEIFQKLVTTDANNAQFQYLLGQAYSNSGLTKEAIAAFNKAIELKPDYIRAYAGLGEVYARSEQRQEAINTYNKALSIKVKPDDAEAYIGFGNINDAVGRKPEAVNAYQQALKVKPDDAEAHFFLGGSYFDLGKAAEAITELNNAIKLNDKFAAAYTFLGVIYGQQGKFNEAVEPLKMAITLNANDLASRQFLGMVYVNLRDKEAALKEYQALKSIDEKIANDLITEINKLDQPAVTNNADTNNVAASAAPVAKTNERIRIGIVNFSNKSGRPVSTDVLRSTLVDLLLDNNIDAVRLNGSNTEIVIAEANKNNCDYILSTEISELILSNRSGAASGRLYNAGDEKESYDVTVSFNLYGKGNTSPLLKVAVKGRSNGEPDAAILSAITQEAKQVSTKLKEKK